MLREGWNFHSDIALRIEHFVRARLGLSLEEVADTIFCADMVDGGCFVESMICLLRNNFGYTTLDTAVNEFIDKAAPFFNMRGTEVDSSTAQELLDEFQELMGDMCDKKPWKNYDELSRAEQPYIDELNHIVDQMNPSLEERGLSMSGFNLPIWIESQDEYDEVIVREMKRYRDKLSSKRQWQEDPSFLEEIDGVISHIQNAIKLERCGETRKAQQEIHEIIASYGRESFFVHPITNNFAFRGTAAFHDKDEDEMGPRQREDLTFFRCRKGKFQKQEELYPLASSMLSFCSAQRYSLAGIPCLYLATTTYCCWMEIGRPEEFSASSYKPTESGKKLRILNLAFSQRQMHNLGKDSRAAYLLFPLVMAVSVAVKNPRADANFRPEYTISHLVMRCLREFGIDGVAYRSSRIDDAFDLLHTINLAIPLFDREEIFSDFLVTDPGTFSPQKCLCKEKQDASGLSYLNKFYTKENTDFYSIACYGNRVDYRDTSFSDIDNYLAGRTYYPMNNEK